jgi:hypothetical protein
MKAPIIIALLMLGILFVLPVFAQEQSRESMAVDATAAQWSYQFAYEGFFDYDTSDGRPEGNKGFLQFRMVAPIPKSESVPFTILPRLTLRLNQNSAGDYGFGSSDIFALIIAQQWSSGRWGIGPQINFPAQENFGNTNWGYGLAGAITERALDDKLFLAFLLQQTWQERNNTSATYANPLGINLILVYQLGDGWYIGNGDFVILYNWQDKAFRVPFGVRLGKAFISPGTTWNFYVEYSTGLYYDDWQGSVPGHAIRVNAQFQIPIGL